MTVKLHTMLYYTVPYYPILYYTILYYTITGRLPSTSAHLKKSSCELQDLHPSTGRVAREREGCPRSGRFRVI